ncbi:MAG: aldehyde dehydrogenase [Actinobacteria bacterium]|nr:aldehyde dehydrogenase [Actinomycetota bacterium]
MYEHDRLFIGGTWTEPAGSEVLEVVSPHSEEVIGRIPRATEADIDRAVTAARAAFDQGPWPRLTPAERIEKLNLLAGLYASRLQDLNDAIVDEMGCPITFASVGQAPIALMILNSFLQIGQTYPWEDRRPGVFGEVVVRREPLGVVAAITPWNVPQFTTMSKLAPALLAGNTVVVKPADETPLDSMILAQILEQAGFPEGVVSVIPAGREVGEHLVRHPGVDKVAFTGSTAAGRRIAAICGEQLKRVSLELGGKSAAIVMDDADLATVVPGIKFYGLMNSGQACIAQTRILASRERYGEVVDALGGMFSSLVVGDPRDPATEVGPMVAQRQQERVEKYIALGQEEGARVVVGGNGRPDGLDKGWYVRPTLFADVDNGMRIAQEEIFGPVLVVIPYDDLDDAVRIANASEYGLAGSVWSTDLDAALDVARRVRTGTLGVNGYAMDFMAPFGGYRASGLGREFGPEGMDQYVELKSILPLAPPPPG